MPGQKVVYDQQVWSHCGSPNDPKSHLPLYHIYFSLVGWITQFPVFVLQLLLSVLPPFFGSAYPCPNQHIALNRIQSYYTPRPYMITHSNCGRSPGELRRRKQSSSLLEGRKRHENSKDLPTHSPLSDLIVLQKTRYADVFSPVMDINGGS